jgi:hypothetical protein
MRSGASLRNTQEQTATRHDQIATRCGRTASPCSPMVGPPSPVSPAASAWSRGPRPCFGYTRTCSYRGGKTFVVNTLSVLMNSIYFQEKWQSMKNLLSTWKLKDLSSTSWSKSTGHTHRAEIFRRYCRS